MMLRPISALLCLSLLVTAACKGPDARIKTADEGDLVGSGAAGSATYRPQIEEAVGKMLASHSAAHQGLTKATVCVLGVENKGAEDLGDWSEQIYQIIDTSIVSSGRYRTVSRRFLDAGLREGNLRQDDLFIPAKRRQFIEIMESQGNPISLLCFPNLTTGTTGSGDTTQRDYILTLEVVDSETGWNEKFAATVRKEYNR